VIVANSTAQNKHRIGESFIVQPDYTPAMARTFTVWAAGDSHVTTDLKRGRRSLADAIEQSESRQGFDWDIMLDVGDTSGCQLPPDDDEGRAVVEQYTALRKHDRAQIYNIAGNHDASGPGEPHAQWWFQKYLDPLGEHTTHSGVDANKRPFAVEGAWDRYALTFGNVRVLMMSDRNDGGPPIGRGERGGYPAGAVTGETFDWWVEQVEAHRDKIIISVHHHMLKQTTVASGPWEGFGERDQYGRFCGGYHGYFADGGPMGASYLYWVDGNPDAQAFERYLAAHPGAIDLWIGGHTHTHPDDTTGGRSHVERKWDVTFLNCCALTRYHAPHSVPMSRVLDFVEGGNELSIRCYMHSNEFLPRGWYDKAARTVPLRHAFAAP
jgi:hypothetical protein